MSSRDDGAQNELSTDDDDDNDAESLDEQEEEGEETPAAVEPVRRPRAQRAPAHVEISTFGAVPELALAWGIKRATSGGRWEVLTYGEGTQHQEWPIPELSEATVRSRWGAGTYRVSWWRATPNGGRKFMCNGRTVTFAAEHAAASASAAASANPSSFDDALRFMNLVNTQASGKLTEVMQLAQFFAQMSGGARAGMSGEDLRVILREEREAQATSTQAAIRAAVEPLERRIAELVDDEDDDEDDDGTSIADAARAAGPALFKGRKWWQQVGQFLTQNPEVVKVALPIAAGAVQNIAGVISSAVTAPAPSPPRPRATLQQAEPMQVSAQPFPPPLPEPAPPSVAAVAPLPPLPADVAPPPTVDASPLANAAAE